MERKGQTGTAGIWGAGAILLAVGLTLFVVAFKENRVGIPELAFLEAFLGVTFMVFGMISFYVAHK